MAIDQQVKNPGRRWFVTRFASRTALAGLGALTLGRLVGRDGVAARAADGDPLIIGRANSASSSTSLTSSSYPAFVAYTDSTSGTGVIGHATANSGEITGVTGASDSPDGVGVFGIITTASPGTVFGKPTAVAGYTNSPTGTGVSGNAASPTGQTNGVRGEAASPDGIGVNGGSPGGIGVAGFSKAASGIGVLAQNPSGTALQVIGLAAFSTVSAGTIPARQSDFAVSDTRVTSSSHITVALTGDPGIAPGPVGPPTIRAAVDWVERIPGVGFTIHLTRITANPTPFTYLIVEPN